MKYILRKLFKKKRRYTPKPSWSTINDLQNQIYRLQSDITNLAKSNGKVLVKGAYMDEKDAQKYKSNGFGSH